jgi:hypothetical protein
LVLDGSGFVRRSQVFAGNAVEAKTLEEMLKGLSAPAGALVVMDRGIAAEANLTWLREHEYRYLVMSRETGRIKPEGDAQVTTASGETLTVMKVRDEAAKEVRLYCPRTLRETGSEGARDKRAFLRALRGGVDQTGGRAQDRAWRETPGSDS